MSTMGAPQLDVLLDELVERVADRVVRRLNALPTYAGELLTIPEAAELLRCKPQRLYDLRSAGRLPRTVEGGRAVVRRSDLDRLVAEE
jgi:excisionase family DNA binding protein